MRPRSPISTRIAAKLVDIADLPKSRAPRSAATPAAPCGS